MTRTQYKKKVEAARRTGTANMPDGSKLIYHGKDLYSVEHWAVYTHGNCTAVTHDANSFYCFYMEG